VEFSSNLSDIYTKSCAQTFPPIFGLFGIFDRNFVKLVASPSNENENCVVHLKTSSKSAFKRQRNARSNYAPLERTARGPRSVTKKRTRNKSIVPRRTMRTGRM